MAYLRKTVSVREILVFFFGKWLYQLGIVSLVLGAALLLLIVLSGQY
jgi:hypothetical protein